MAITLTRLKLLDLDEDTRRFVESVVEFFKENAELAYNESEIRHALLNDSAPTWEKKYLRELLTNLADLDLLDERVVHGTFYYRFKKDLDSI